VVGGGSSGSSFFLAVTTVSSGHGRGGSLWYWRDRTREVDFVVDRGGRVELLEAKFTELPGAGDAGNLRHVQRLLGDSVDRSVVVCRTPNPYPVAEGIAAESPLHWA
jgi:predicted AAA+ superfamily ATPase